AVENHDLAGGWEALDVALHVHLRFLAVGRRGQRHHAEHARTHPLGKRLDGAALAGGIAALEDDDDALAALLDPRLQMAELDLTLAHFLFVFLALEFLLLAVLLRAVLRPILRHGDPLSAGELSRQSPGEYSAQSSVLRQWE